MGLGLAELIAKAHVGDPGAGRLVRYLARIAHAAATRLRLRAGADPETVWQSVEADITRLLAGRRFDHVTVERAEEAPQQPSFP